MAISESLPKPVVTPYATAPERTSRSTMTFARAIRSSAEGASSTSARLVATATTSSSVSDCPSRTTTGGMRAMSTAREDNSREPRRRLAVVELQVRLRLERDEEVEGEAAVGRLREGEDGAPVVQIALERHDLAREAAALEIVVRLPRGRPLLGDLEAQAAAQRGRGWRAIERRAGEPRGDRHLGRRIGELARHAVVIQYTQRRGVVLHAPRGRIELHDVGRIATGRALARR